jgi:hypothetical protein
MNTQLEEYLLLCQRIYERMERENAFPWQTQDEELSDTNKKKNEE